MHRFGDDARNVAVREGRPQRLEVVELDDSRQLRQVGDLAQQAGAVDDAAVDQPHEGFVHGAVVAAVEDEDLRPAGHGPRDAQGEAIGVGGRRGDLPVRQAEALGQQAADFDRILGRQHVGQALAGLARHGLGHGRRRMAEHRTGVAEAEIGIFVAVDVAQRRASCRGDDEGERHRPVAHPVHRHAVVEARDAVARALQRARVCRDVTALLRLEDVPDPLQRNSAQQCRCHDADPAGSWFVPILERSGLTLRSGPWILRCEMNATAAKTLNHRWWWRHF